MPEGFVELEIFIDAFDGPALRHPASVGPAARVVALTATDNVFLNRVQGGPKILCSVSETSGIEKHRRVDRGVVRILPPVSYRARGQGKAFRISQDPILEEPYLLLMNSRDKEARSAGSSLKTESSATGCLPNGLA